MGLLGDAIYVANEICILQMKYAYDIMPVGKKRCDKVPCERRANPPTVMAYS